MNLKTKLSGILLGLVLIAGSAFSFKLFGGDESKGSSPHEAMFYRKLENNQVWCQLCPRKCIIPDGRRGVCGNRENRGGTLYSITYGKPCSIGVEPIEKAPFYHFNPGHARFVVATVGCNLRYKFCQNWNISQAALEDVRYYNLSPAELVEEALKNKVYSICFTFTEPVASYEYMYDTALLAREKGLKTALVSAGYINPEPLKKLLTALDAVKIDLKAYSPEFYQNMCAADLGPVLETLKTIRQAGTWLEIVNLVIPGYNDDPVQIKQMCEWIKTNLGPDVPLHFTRFFPAYKLTTVSPTPVETLERAYKIARAVGLHYVYVGNVPGNKYDNTVCPKCGKMLIQRAGFQVLANNIKDGKCKFCGFPIKGLWK